MQFPYMAELLMPEQYETSLKLFALANEYRHSDFDEEFCKLAHKASLPVAMLRLPTHESAIVPLLIEVHTEAFFVE